MANTKNGRWSYSAGRPPYVVRVYERSGSSNIYVSTWENGREVRRSLGHDDRDGAKDYADELNVKIRKAEGTASAETAPPNRTLGHVVTLYLEHRSPDKGERSQENDKRSADLWKRALGESFNLPDLSRREWDAFKRNRRSGAIDARGRHVPAGKRTEVRPRTVEKDCRWLRSVCNWAMGWKDEHGRWLLEADPTRGLEIPKEANPRRPVASTERVEAIRKVYNRIPMRLERGGKCETVPSWFAEIFELVVATGRRISAVCALRVEDLELERSENAPHGAIRWPAETDKMGKASRVRLGPSGREAVDRALSKRKGIGRVGRGPLFPSPEDPSKPVPKATADDWMHEAERLAKLEPLDWGLWHPYRRRWATLRKGYPVQDVARAGGWGDIRTLEKVYQHADDNTEYDVITHEDRARGTA